MAVVIDEQRSLRRVKRDGESDQQQSSDAEPP
jgi:hypothetical protein